MQPRACPSIPWTLRRGMPRVLFTIGVFSASTAAFEEPPSPALCSRLPTEEAGDPTESPTTIPAGARDRSLVPPERARPPSDRVGGSITSVRCLRRDWADRGGPIPLPRQKPSPTERRRRLLSGVVPFCRALASHTSQSLAFRSWRGSLPVCVQPEQTQDAAQEGRGQEGGGGQCVCRQYVRSRERPGRIAPPPALALLGSPFVRAVHHASGPQQGAAEAAPETW